MGWMILSTCIISNVGPSLFILFILILHTLALAVDREGSSYCLQEFNSEAQASSELLISKKVEDGKPDPMYVMFLLLSFQFSLPFNSID